jgi:DNA-directed RNA polymerase specialized sigma24 family protein
MTTYTERPLTSKDDYNNDAFWEVLYPRLSTLIRGWVHTAGVATWKRQEQDLVEDIVQTAIEKIFKSLRDAREHNEVIDSVPAWSMRIARNCFFDLIRRESRLLHFSQNEMEAEERQLPVMELLADSTLEIEEKLYEEWAITASAKKIATFSTKLRQAILADLANRACFDEEPSTLQQAFLAAGIRLQDYQRAPSPDPAERGRQSALRSLAYKRVSQAHVV